MDALTNRLRSLELDLDGVMAHAGLAYADSLTNRSLCKVDADMAVVLERMSCYPVCCSLEHADANLSIRFHQRAAAMKEANVCDDAMALHGVCRRFNPSRVQEIARFTKISYFEHARQGYEVRTKTIMRTIKLSDRLIYLQSSLSSLASERLTFYEDCIVIVRQPPSSTSAATVPPSESLLLGWHRIRAEHHGETAPRIDLRLNELVMNSASDRLEAHLRGIKDHIQDSQTRTETPSSTQLAIKSFCPRALKGQAGSTTISWSRGR